MPQHTSKVCLAPSIGTIKDGTSPNVVLGTLGYLHYLHHLDVLWSGTSQRGTNQKQEVLPGLFHHLHHLHHHLDV